MQVLARFWSAIAVDNDPLAPFRAKIATHISATTVLALLPFTLSHLAQGRVALGLAIGLGQLVLALDTWRLRQGRPAPVPFSWVTGVFCVAICSAVWIQGAASALWAYPALFICYFVLSRRQALIQSVGLATAVSALVALNHSPELAVRTVATLVVTLVMINVVLGVIGELQSALVRQSITDPLTGAYNRRHLHEQLDRTDAVPDHRQAWAMLAIDIDHFKRINDRHGHAVGDEVLRRVVELVSDRKRKSDLLFRTGGEEFVLLLPDTAQDDALRVADQLRQRVAEAVILPEGEPVTVSIGLSMRRSGQAADAWMREADNALYDAKRNGRNRIELALA
jgi:diguanylate cyclase (GGDEF)-like protein